MISRWARRDLESGHENLTVMKEDFHSIIYSLDIKINHHFLALPSSK